jgi:hypothetical protein
MNAATTDDPARNASFRAGALAGLGLASLVCYLALNLLVPLAPLYMEAPSAALAHGWVVWRGLLALPSPGGALVVAIALAAAVVPIAAFAGAVWLAWRAPATPLMLGLVLGFAVLFFLSSALSLPHNSNDLYGYIAYARVLGVYGANPYAVPPIAFAPDPFVALAGPGWMEVTTPYGPVWMLFSGLLAWLGGDSPARTLMIFRGFLFACNLAILAFIYHTLKRHNPAHLLAGLLFFAWNPAVALKGQSHNEPLMLLFLLAGIAVYLGRRKWLGLAGLVLSALTKFVTAPMVLLYLLRLRRGPLERLVVPGLVLAAAAAGFWLLFAPQELGLGRLLVRIAGQGTGELPGRVLVSGLALAAAMLWAAWRDRGSDAQMLASWAVVLYAWLLFYPNSTYTWHAITLVGLASLVRVPAIAILATALVASFHINNMLVSIVNDFAPLPLGVEPTARLVRWGIPLAVWLGLLLHYALGRLPARPATRAASAPPGDTQI